MHPVPSGASQGMGHRVRLSLVVELAPPTEGMPGPQSPALPSHAGVEFQGRTQTQVSLASAVSSGFSLTHVPHRGRDFAATSCSGRPC